MAPMPNSRGGITEAEFTSSVVALFQLHGWRVCHIRPARTSRGWRTAYEGHAGLPDIIAARGGVVIMAELKVGKGKLSADQVEWLKASGSPVWRPEDWDTILLVAREGGRRG